jgi:hypothetical protein
MLFEFEYQGIDESGPWKPAGTAEGSGDAAVADAFYELAGDHGGGMDTGDYRVRPEGDQATPWLIFTLDINNNLLFR